MPQSGSAGKAPRLGLYAKDKSRKANKNKSHAGRSPASRRTTPESPSSSQEHQAATIVSSEVLAVLEKAGFSAARAKEVARDLKQFGTSIKAFAVSGTVVQITWTVMSTGACGMSRCTCCVDCGP